MSGVEFRWSENLPDAAAILADASNPHTFSNLAELYRRELQVHCYRMLGSYEDAEDLVQETLLRAWRRRETYQGRASLRAWLYKIATNACLDALERRARRSLPFAVSLDSDPSQLLAPPINDPVWLDPYPTQQLEDLDSNPEARFALRESVRLAFMVALHGLAPRQRAVLILRDVLDWPVSEIAQLLDTTVSAVNSALHRARVALNQTYQGADPESVPLSDSDEATRRLLERYVRAWETADISALASLLREDALLSMPPSPSWYRGRSAVLVVVGGMAFSSSRRDRWRMVPTSANAQPAFAFYEYTEPRAVYQAFGLQILDVRDGLVASIVAFTDPTILGRFGLPSEFSR